MPHPVLHNKVLVTLHTSLMSYLLPLSHISSFNIKILIKDGSTYQLLSKVMGMSLTVPLKR